MLCTPAVSVLVVHAAVRLLPPPSNATAEHAAIDAPPSLKATVPVGLAPVTVAVKVTLAPTVDGFGALAGEQGAIAEVIGRRGRHVEKLGVVAAAARAGVIERGRDADLRAKVRKAGQGR